MILNGFVGKYIEAKSGVAEASCERENSTERNAHGDTGTWSVWRFLSSLPH